MAELSSSNRDLPDALIILHCCLAHYKSQGYSYYYQHSECHMYCHSTIFLQFLLPAHTHKVGTTKEKSKFKCHVFKAQKSMDYFVTKLDGKALCVLYKTLQLCYIKKKNTLPNSALITVFPAHQKASHNNQKMYLFLLWAMPCSLWDLSFLTRD